MIRPEQMIPLFLESCPELQPIWTRHVVQTMNSKSTAVSRSPVLAVVFPYLLGHVKRNYFTEIPAAFAVMETLLSDGDEETRIAVETEILFPLYEATTRLPQSAMQVKKRLGPRALAVWHAIGHIHAEPDVLAPEELPREEPEQCEVAAPVTTTSDTGADPRYLYAALGLVGSGSLAFFLMGADGKSNLLSLVALLLIWIGLSVVERFQRQQLMRQAQAQDAVSDNAPAPAAFHLTVQRMWTLLDGAISMIFVLGVPIVLSIVMGQQNFLDSTVLDMLIVMVGAAAVVAILFRDRLWKHFGVREIAQALRDQHVRDEHDPAVC